MSHFAPLQVAFMTLYLLFELWDEIKDYTMQTLYPSAHIFEKSSLKNQVGRT